MACAEGLGSPCFLPQLPCSCGTRDRRRLTWHEDSSCRPGQGTGPGRWELDGFCSTLLCLWVSEATDSVGSDLTSCASSPQLRIILALSPVSCLSNVPGKWSSRHQTNISKNTGIEYADLVWHVRKKTLILEAVIPTFLQQKEPAWELCLDSSNFGVNYNSGLESAPPFIQWNRKSI